MAYDNTNSGMLYKNDDKQKDTHPDYKGFVDVDGVEYWLSAWIRVGKSGKLEGKKYFSIALEPKEEAKSKKAPSKGESAADMDDDIPF